MGIPDTIMRISGTSPRRLRETTEWYSTRPSPDAVETTESKPVVCTQSWGFIIAVAARRNIQTEIALTIVRGHANSTYATSSRFLFANITTQNVKHEKSEKAPLFARKPNKTPPHRDQSTNIKTIQGWEQACRSAGVLSQCQTGQNPWTYILYVLTESSFSKSSSSKVSHDYSFPCLLVLCPPEVIPSKARLEHVN